MNASYLGRHNGRRNCDLDIREMGFRKAADDTSRCQHRFEEDRRWRSFLGVKGGKMGLFRKKKNIERRTLNVERRIKEPPAAGLFYCPGAYA